MTTPATEREKLSKIISDLPDEHVPVVLDMLEVWSGEEDLSPDEETALMDYQSEKRNGTLETISLEDVWRNLNLDN